MIVAQRKPFEEIVDNIKEYSKVLTVGCGTCVAVCLVGGEKEVATLNSELYMYRQLANKPIQLGAKTLERQCDNEFLAELDSLIEDYEAILSLACGVGIQFLAERFPHKPVFPGVNTSGMAANLNIGWYEERCRGCGECVLAYTGGICPVTMCAKGLFNGPCGGTNGKSCEINPDQPCAWYMIYDRLSKQGRLDNILKIQAPQEWHNQLPRNIIQPGYENMRSNDL